MLEFLQQHTFTLLLLQTRNKPAEELLETQQPTSDNHLQTAVNGHQPSLVATFIPKFSLARTKGRSWVLGEHHLHVSNNPLTYDFTPPTPPKFGYWDASKALFPVGDRPGQGSSDDTQTLTCNPLQNKQSSLSSSIFLHSINKYILSMYYVPFTAVVSWECSHDLPSHLIKRASKSPNYPFITECCYFCLINNAFTEQKTEVGEFQKTEP